MFISLLLILSLLGESAPLWLVIISAAGAVGEVTFYIYLYLTIAKIVNKRTK